MWLNPLKGAHLTLGQLDKTLPVDKTVDVNAGIERGSIVFIKAGANGKDTPRFQLYTDTEAQKPNAVPYVALMGIKDFQAGMAGSVGQAPEAEGIDKGTPGGTNFLGKADVVGAGGIRGPRITAISLVQPAEWETTAFDKTKKDDFYVGMPLSVNDEGKLTPWTTGRNIVGYVTKTPTMRWINDLGASADGARISGGNAMVIAYSTAWIPVASVEHKDAVAADPDATPPVEGSAEVPGNVKPLSLKGGAPAGAPAPAAGAKADAPAGAKVDNTKTK